jgi:hypothetical protein
MISAFVFVSGIFGFISDSDKTCGKESDKACFRPFPFRFQPYIQQPKTNVLATA